MQILPIKLAETYPHISTETMQVADLKCETFKLYSGKTSFSGKNLLFTIQGYIFDNSLLVFRLYYEAKDTDLLPTTKEIGSLQAVFSTNDGSFEDQIFNQVIIFYTKLFKLTEFVDRIKLVDALSEKRNTMIRQICLEYTGLVMQEICGDQVINGQMYEDPTVIVKVADTEHFTPSATDFIAVSDQLTEIDTIFIRRCHALYYYKLLNITNTGWLDGINEKSTFLLNNLNNPNKFFWQKTRHEFEEWNLNLIRYLSTIDLYKIKNETNLDKYFTKIPAQQWKLEIDAIQREVDEKLQTIKNLVATITLPTQNQQAQHLQKETERTNERILLLTFIALAVSLISTIFNAQTAFSIRFLSISITLAIPLLYWLAVRTFHKRESGKDYLRYLEKELSDENGRIEMIQAGLVALNKLPANINNGQNLGKMIYESNLQAAIFRRDALMKKLKKL